jgi:hypothetical protein
VDILLYSGWDNDICTMDNQIRDRDTERQVQRNSETGRVCMTQRQTGTARKREKRYQAGETDSDTEGEFD